MNKLIFFLVLANAIPLFAASPDDCSKLLSGKRPDRKTLGVGALLQLKPQLKQLALSPKATMTFKPADKINLYKEGGFLEGGWALPPGLQLRTLSPYQKKDGIAFVDIEVPGTDMKGFMHWIDLYNNTFVIEGGTPPTSKPVAKKAKFPDQGHPIQFETLAAQGQTIYGRPFAKLGDLVWIATPNRSMSRKSVGTLTQILHPLIPGVWNSRGMAVVHTLAGADVPVYHYDCNPISQDEADLVEVK